MSFCETLETQTTYEREAMMSHPFVLGIGDGTLRRDRFRHFMVQDYLFLIDYARALATGAAKARETDDMAWFASATDYILNTEMDLHRSYCTSIGISTDELERAQPTPTTYGYTGYLLRVATLSTVPELMAALVPCVWGYWQVGERLKAAGKPSVTEYAQWIETYAGPENAEVAESARNLCDRLATNASDQERQAMREAYVTCWLWERAFWQAAWDMETW